MESLVLAVVRAVDGPHISVLQALIYLLLCCVCYGMQDLNGDLIYTRISGYGQVRGLLPKPVETRDDCLGQKFRIDAKISPAA